MPGEFATTIREISEKTGIPKTTVYRKLKTLADVTLIVMKVEHKLTVISVTNWDSYQKNGTMAEQKWDNNGTTSAVNPCPSMADEGEKKIRSKEYTSGLRQQPSTRTGSKYPQEDYQLVLTEYQRIKRLTLQGEEFKPVLLAIKSMFMSDRTPQQIIAFMQWLENCPESWTKLWTMDTVKKKMPDFLGGRLDNSRSGVNEAKDTQEALIAIEKQRNSNPQ